MSFSSTVWPPMIYPGAASVTGDGGTFEAPPAPPLIPEASGIPATGIGGTFEPPPAPPLIPESSVIPPTGNGGIAADANAVVETTYVDSNVTLQQINNFFGILTGPVF